MDSLPSYRDHVAGDQISWTLALREFIRDFVDGEDRAIHEANLSKVDQVVHDLITRAESNAASDAAAAPRDAAIAAASKLIQNHKAIVADASAGDVEPKSQSQLARLPSTAAPVVEHVLLNAAARLLG